MELFQSNNHKNNEMSASVPLPERMRPKTIQKFMGQTHLLGPGKPLRRILETGLNNSLILWGPPGSGKTTIARLIASQTKAHFIEYSAVLSGIKQIKEVVKYAEYLKQQKHIPTILFIDEIHRFNKAQQDAFLPHVEKGTILLLGATTENPSFEVISALLSRTTVFTLKPLNESVIETIIENALIDEVNGIKSLKPIIDAQTKKLLAKLSNGDARVALSALEFALQLTEVNNEGCRIITEKTIGEALQNQPAQYDKSGESHFNMISALHKSLRGSDPQASIYWLARMLEGGENPLYIARRMVRFASEDIGLADPRALSVAIAARDAFHFLGSPEGELALAQCAVYLATAPKSNSIYSAFSAARKQAKDTTHLPVPKSIRNAPTQLMKELGYGENYQYDHDQPHHYSGQDFLPDDLLDAIFYKPGSIGFEKEISKRIAWWKNLKKSKLS